MLQLWVVGSSDFHYYDDSYEIVACYEKTVDGAVGAESQAFVGHSDQAVAVMGYA